MLSYDAVSVRTRGTKNFLSTRRKPFSTCSLEMIPKPDGGAQLAKGNDETYPE